MANRKKKGWFDFVKSFFRLDARSRSEKKERRRKWAFERLQNRRLPPLVAPSQRPSLTDAEEVQNKSALNVAIATAAAAEAAVAAAQIAAEVFKLSASVQISQPTSQTKQEKDQCSVTVIQKDSSDNVTAEVPVKQQCESEIHHIEGIKIKAAIAIQAAFRGYLARKALRALKGIVKLQALIRGRAVRRQAITTLKRLQSIVNIHSQVCATRSNEVERTWNCSENCQMKLWRDKIKVEKINTRRWDDSLLSKDKEDALVLSKKEAALKRERIREYSFNHRKSAESENRKPNGRWRYWLEQWVDTQLNKSKEFEDLDPVIGTNPKSKEENGGRQLRPRSNLRPQQQPPPKQQHETSESPMSSARRQFRHKKQSSAGDDIFPSSPSVPTYMAATESAKAKARSLSSPKLRPGAFDAYSDSYSPYKNKLSLVSSIVSEVPTLGSTYRSVKPIGQQQRSPSLKGLPSAVKSTRVAKDLNFD